MTTQHILNLEAPRAFTTTIKAFDFRTANILHASNVAYDAIDLNLLFWKFVLSFSSEGVQIESFVSESLLTEHIHAFISATQKIREQFGAELHPNGYHLNTYPTRAADIDDIIEQAKLRPFMVEFSRHFVEHFGLNERHYDVIAITCTSVSTLVLSQAIADILKSILSNQPKFVLIGHGYENFSLRFRQKDLERNGHLLKHFDAVAYTEEAAAEILIHQCGAQPATQVSKPERALMEQIFEESLYLKSIIIGHNHCPILLRLSRNPCYWRRCNFCVQNHKYQAGASFQESAEIDVAVIEIDILYKHGFRYFIFSDEAVSPASIKRLVKHLDDTKTHIHWTPRLTANADFDEYLVEKMGKTGCFEVLLGLETVSEITAIQMGKMTFKDRRQTAENQLATYHRNGIGNYLNLIYRFPTEPDEQFQAESYDFYQKMAGMYPGITWQFNAFALFYGSDVFHNQEKYGLKWIEEATPEHDLKMDFDFEDQFGRRPAEAFVPEYHAATIGVPMDYYNTIEQNFGNPFLQVLLQVSYASFGVMHKAQHGDNILYKIYAGNPA